MLITLTKTGKNPSTLIIDFYDIKRVIYKKGCRTARITVKSPTLFPPHEERKEYVVTLESWEKAEAYLRKRDYIHGDNDDIEIEEEEKEN